MVKKATNTRRTTTRTDGVLSRVYIHDWRSEPVGKVKKYLRREIGEWLQQRMVEDGQEDDGNSGPDVDSVRHVNQFGSPEVPIMEVACVPAKAEAVREFFRQNGIDV